MRLKTERAATLNPSNLVANVTSARPGGAGVTQAFNVPPLKGITSSTNAIV